MKKLILVMLITLAGLSGQAQDKKEKSKNAKYEISVNGNCGICKKRIEKAAYSVTGVKSAVWSEDNHDMKLILDENKANIDDVHTAVAKAGHDTDKVKAKDDDYEKLHSCCQYERL